jgi:uncharacterized membrane protein
MHFPLVSPLRLWYQYLAFVPKSFLIERGKLGSGVLICRVGKVRHYPSRGFAKGEKGMAFCAKCGAQLAEGVTFCGACGAPVGAAASPVGMSPVAPAATASAGGGLASNVAGALAYVTIIPAIIFLVMEPYNKDRFIKFHSFQCLFFAAAMFAISIVLMIVGFILAFIPVVGWLLDLLLWLVYAFGSLGLVIFLIYKAYNNEKFMVPVIGKFAEEQASK